MQGYEIVTRGNQGEPLRILCRTHPDCTWGMDVTGRRADDDPILTAQFQQHLREAQTPPRVFGHVRRKRL